MHPILTHRRSLALYLVAWILLGTLLALVLTGPEPSQWTTGLLLVVPLALVYSFVCMAAWYPSRAMPLAVTGGWRLLFVHGTTALVAGSLWLFAGRVWSQALGRLPHGGEAAQLHAQNLPLFLSVGTLLYLLATTGFYLVLAFQASRQAESRALELKLLARQAELEAFKAQIDPHFLFNCLNSISSLCGSDPSAARLTAIRLGELLRASVRLAADATIPLADELALATTYLEVERVRFGERLTYDEEVAEDCRELPVPALFLQPLLENSLKHGISHLIEGGTVRITGRRNDGQLTISVANPCDPSRPESDSTHIGLANVRGRLRLLYDRRAVLRVVESSSSFKVEILLPVPEPTEPELARPELPADRGATGREDR